MTGFIRSVTLILSTGIALAGMAQQIQIDKNNRTIAITTSDSAKAVADVARLHIGYLAYAPDAKSAYAKASDLSNAIIGNLKKAGVPDSAIESDSQMISEQQNLPESLSEAERAERRYLVSQTWTVISSAKLVGEALDIAVNSGTNNSGDINWSLKDENALQAQASANALERARKIAAEMAKGLGGTLGPLIYASNEAPPPPNFALHNDEFRGGLGGGAGGGFYGQKPLPPLVIIPQQVTKSATVYAVFALQ